ncbi:MAG: trypsin-like peptidase domain-containing protein [Chloroflexi bacterium]|nr:trypsin-like peptidase domain-containing protein [Chloroflexota bacterium]
MLEPLPWVGRILWEDKVLGMGFVVHSSGLIATCYHVLQDAVGASSFAGQEFTFELLSGKASFTAIASNKFNDKFDLALLRLSGNFPTDLPVARLVASHFATAGAEFQVQGFGTVRDDPSNYRYLSALGKVIGVAEREGLPLLQLKSEQILQGMSGSPICIPSLNNAVVGVLFERYKVRPNETFMRDTAWATPIEQLVQLDSKNLALTEPEPKPEKPDKAQPAPVINNKNITAYDHGIAAESIGTVNIMGGESQKSPPKPPLAYSASNNSAKFEETLRGNFLKKQKLIKLLLACPSIEDRVSRDNLLKEVRKGSLVTRFARNAVDNIDMENIVNTLLAFSGALEELISFIQLKDADTQAFQALETFYGPIL